MELNIKMIEKLIDIAIIEDIGSGDITTDNLISSEILGKAKIVAKEDFIVAGLDVASMVLEKFDKNIQKEICFKDGDEVKSTDVLMSLQGSVSSLLKAERIVLNFLQRLSGIATKTREYTLELKGLKTRLLDTRKTIPGFRVLEKYAVRVGGGYNHRMGLYDGVLIKDNHIAMAGGIKKAVASIRKKISHLIKIEVEVSNFDELKEAIESKVDVIMLDNMNLSEIKKAVKFIDKRALIEVSGDIRKENLKPIAMAGVDIISSGAITHQATAVDISMRLNF